MKKYKFFVHLNMILYAFVIITLVVFMFSLRWPYPGFFPILSPQLMEITQMLHQVLPVIASSVMLSLTVSIFTLVICFPAAKALVFYDFYGKSLVKTLLVMPIIIPIIAVAMGIHLTMIRLGLSNTITGVVLVQVIPCIPYVVRILMNSYEVIGNKIEIQAKVLGASKFETLRYVSFPMLKHAISSALKMAFILSYSQYIITLIIGGGIVKTHSVIIFPIIQSGSRSEIALNSLLFIISIVFVNWLIDKVFSYVKEAK